MGFSTKQIHALRRNLKSAHIRTKERHGRELSYVEAWHAIAEANRIFGFDGWDRETIESRCVVGREIRGSYHAVYVAKVRITVRADGHAVVREGHGSGEGRGSSIGETHDIALKAAETDATKRALATFGKPFGLALYLKDRPPVLGREVPVSPPVPANANVPAGDARSPRPASIDDTGGEAGAAQPARTQVETAVSDASQRPAASQAEGAQCGPDLLRPLATFPGIIDGVLPRRIRDRAHLKFVTTQPCLLCGRRPSDAHHLTFAQPRAMGMKVSDEFTVPLCRLHHREVHNGGNEARYWSDLEIDALAIARGLWDERQQKRGPPPAAE